MTRQKIVIAAVCGVIGASACAASDEAGTPAGEAAQARGVASYVVEQRGDVLAIELVAPDLSTVGELEIAAIPEALAELVLFDDGEVHLERYSQIVRYRDHGEVTELFSVARFTPVYVDFPDLWATALTDPSLAIAFGSRGFTFVAGRSPEEVLGGTEIEYFGESAGCAGHRQGADLHLPVSLYQYMGCNTSGSLTGTFGTSPYWHRQTGSCSHHLHGLRRNCNHSCCAGGNCFATGGASPCGAPYGAAGCYTEPGWEHWDSYYSTCW